MKYDKGFTLIEVVIYIALFALLMGSAFVTVFQLINGTNKISLKTTIQQEGNFVMRKLDWALTGLDPANPPVVGGSSCSQNLTLQKVNFPGNPMVVRLNSSTLEISQNGGTFVPLTTINVKTTCLKFRVAHWE